LTLAEAPGAIEPVAKLPLSAVALCVAVSLLVHVTVVPTATVCGFGENAVVVNVRAPLTMDTLAGAGVEGAAGVGEELLLHPAKHSPAKRSTPHLIDMRDPIAKNLPSVHDTLWATLRSRMLAEGFRKLESFSEGVTRQSSLGGRLDVNNGVPNLQILRHQTALHDV
jgi:hypothetical protein